jgi:hypothetical protein
MAPSATVLKSSHAERRAVDHALDDRNNTRSPRRKSLCDELRSLIGPCPGIAPLCLARVRAILGDVEWGGDLHARENAIAVLEDFELWFSEGGWRPYCGDIPDRFRLRLLLAIEKLSVTPTRR